MAPLWARHHLRDSEPQPQHQPQPQASLAVKQDKSAKRIKLNKGAKSAEASSNDAACQPLQPYERWSPGLSAWFHGRLKRHEQLVGGWYVVCLTISLRLVYFSWHSTLQLPSRAGITNQVSLTRDYNQSTFCARLGGSASPTRQPARLNTCWA